MEPDGVPGSQNVLFRNLRMQPKKLFCICKSVLHYMLLKSFKGASEDEIHELRGYMSTATEFLESVGQKIIERNEHGVAPLRLFSPFIHSLRVTTEAGQVFCIDEQVRWPLLSSLEVVPYDALTDVTPPSEFLDSTFPRMLRLVCSSSLCSITLHFCSDDILFMLAHFCPNLQLMDFRYDEIKSVSDIGLTAVTSCRNLHTLKLNSTGDEYDGDNYQRLTEVGVSNVVSLLPKLNILEVEAHLLRKAVYRLQKLLGDGVKLPLKSFTILPDWKSVDADDDVNFLFTALKLFPEIEMLEFIRPNMLQLHSLMPTQHRIQTLAIREKSISDHSWVKKVGSNLTSLRIVFCSMKERMLEAINYSCPQLRSLEIILSHRLPDAGYTPADIVPMPNLETLLLRGDLTARMLYRFIINTSLVTLLIEPAVDGVVTDQLIRKVFTTRTYPKLQSVVLLSCIELKAVSFVFILSHCKNLRKLGNVHDADPSFYHTLKGIIRKHNLKLELTV